MLCQKCKKNEANVYYRENVNGKEKNYALCADCARELEEKGEISMSLGGGLFDMPFGMPSLDPAGFFGSLFGALTPAVPAASGHRCSLCGSTFADFVESGKAGCPQCYEDFATELSGTISRIHGDTVHRGRTPRAWKKKLDRSNRLKELKGALSKAVAEEQFEHAAELRDQIRALEAEKTDGADK